MFEYVEELIQIEMRQKGRQGLKLIFVPLQGNGTIMNSSLERF